MNARCLVILALAVLTTACESAPVAPTAVPRPSTPSVPTSRPGVWDSRDEFAAWIANGVNAGLAALVGDGNEAVIRIDLPAGAPGTSVQLRSPSFDAPVTDLRTICVYSALSAALE